MALAAVIFDLDGVLLDSESVWDAARRALVAERGGRWLARATADMQGMSAPEWSRYMHDQLGVALAPAQIGEHVAAAVLERYQSELPLLGGAAAAVERIASRWPLALASSANRAVIDAVLLRSGLRQRFGATVSSEEVARGKPAPDVYLAAARKLAVSPGQCAAVEDSTNGLRAASAAGMLVVAIPNRSFPPDAEALALADLVLQSLHELTPDALVAASPAAAARSSGA